jgi:hypothetical protein
LRRAGEMKRCKPHLVCVTCELGAKEALAAVEPTEGILLALVGRERKLMIARDAGGLGFWWNIGSRWRFMRGRGSWHVRYVHD